MHLSDSSSRVTYGTKISDRIWKDNNNQLICRDCIIARTGFYDYLESDVVEGGDPNKIVKVYRSPEEVFDPVSIASFENKPFCNDHPDVDVTPENARELQCGFIRNVVRGKGDLSNCLMCDIIVTDPDVINLIETGEKRELSLGYDTNIVEKNGNYEMTNIRGNHLALVDSGRAGCATIRDNAIRFNKKSGGKEMFNKFNTKLYDDDEDIIEVEEIKPEEAVEEVPAEDCGTIPTQHDDDSLVEVLNKLDEILSLLKAPKAEPETDADEDVKKVEEAPQSKVETADADEDLEKKEPETAEGDQLLDADEDIEEDVTSDDVVSEDDADEEPSELVKNQDSARAYSKFADSKSSKKLTVQDEITKIFQDRYNKSAGIED